MADLIDDVRREASQHLALRVKAEIDLLQAAKRAALAMADERSKENVKLRFALKAIADDPDTDSMTAVYARQALQ
jgi:hypothetical protein